MNENSKERKNMSYSKPTIIAVDSAIRAITGCSPKPDCSFPDGHHAPKNPTPNAYEADE
jgi:hypothetical protein